MAESLASSLVSGTRGTLSRYLSLLNEGVDKQMSERTSVAGAQREEVRRR